jgi:endonuclease YncB( thermonuclease family)
VSVLGVRSSRRATISGGALVLVTMLAVGAMACGGDQASSSSQASADVTTSTTASPPSSTTSEPLAITTTTGATPAPEPVAGTPAIVESITDGDTFRTTGGERVRLIGIDTPEVHGGTECGGAQASTYMERIATGRRVSVRTDPTQDTYDRYGRLLAYLDAAGTDLGEAVLRAGWARVYVYDQPFRRLAAYRQAGRRAHGGDRGAWSSCSGSTP